MFKKLDKMVERYRKLTELTASADVLARMDEWKKYSKELADMQETVDKYLEYKKAEQDLAAAKDLLLIEEDREMKALLEEEISSCKDKLEKIAAELKILLIPKDPDDEKNVIIEIRAGAGGDEAGLFAYDLYRMYLKYAEKNRWKCEDLDSSATELGGMKEVVFSVAGRGVYSRLKYESGVHRVQRVPETESQGRIHTSTVTVAVLPEADGRGSQYRRKRSEDRYPPFERCGRAARQQNGIVHPHDPPSHGHRGFVPGRALADQEQGKGDAHYEEPPLRLLSEQIRKGIFRKPPFPDRHGGPFGAHQNL